MTVKLIDEVQAELYFWDLWNAAFKKHGFDTFCTLLRVDGLHDAGWDPLEESAQAFDDYNWHLTAKDSALSEKSAWRIGLLMYCQAVEMSAIHAMLGNLLRILEGKPYRLNPLGPLGRVDKKRMFKWYPPSAKTKWKKLRDMAAGVGQQQLVLMIDQMFSDDVRNSFSHSDYVITEKHFRWTEGGLAQQLPLEDVSALITNSFTFIGRFMHVHERALTDSATMGRRYHKWPQYEVLELLKSEGKLSGFRVHFSNGASARFHRGPDGVDCMNVIINGNGTINFMCGQLDLLEPRWKVDGREVDFGSENSRDQFE